MEQWLPGFRAMAASSLPETAVQKIYRLIKKYLCGSLSEKNIPTGGPRLA